MRRMPIDEDIPLSLLPVFRAASDRYCTPVEADQSHYRRLHADYRRSRYKVVLFPYFFQIGSKRVFFF